MWADNHTGNVIRAERQFVHNSKISSSAKNDKKAFEKSRQHNKPQGRYIGIPQMLHQLLGYSEVHSTMKFKVIETSPFEYRTTTKIKLDSKGRLVAEGGKKKASDLASIVTDSCSLCKSRLPVERHFTASQQLLFKPTNKETASSYDKITLFGLRPVELLKLFPRVRQYYEWFVFDKKALGREDIAEHLDADVTKCWWIDGIGRRVRLRKQVAPLVARWLRDMDEKSFEHEYI